MKYYDIDQNTDEWFSLRLGRFTTSTFKNLFAAKTTQAYNKEINRVVFETLTGKQPESFSNDYMLRGHELEPLAREAYEAKTFNLVSNGGFFTLDEMIGSSPDGLIGDDGLLEIKCPAFNTMIEYLLKQKLPTEYYYQVHGQMYVTGRQWCDFVAYHPDLPMMVIRIDRDETVIKEIEDVLQVSIVEVMKKIDKIKPLILAA
jgi:putative phage-type endonuclease